VCVRVELALRGRSSAGKKRCLYVHLPFSNHYFFLTLPSQPLFASPSLSRTPDLNVYYLARYYLKVMGKLSADGGFLAKETARLQKMVDDKAVKPAKKEQFGRRLNVLTSFA